jgi:hypothetical protein
MVPEIVTVRIHAYLTSQDPAAWIFSFWCTVRSSMLDPLNMNPADEDGSPIIPESAMPISQLR